MIEFTVSVDSAATRRMLRAAPRQIDRATRLWLDDASLLVLRDLTLYPVQPAGTTYRRTFTLQRSWSRTIVMGSGFNLHRRMSWMYRRLGG